MPYVHLSTPSQNAPAHPLSPFLSPPDTTAVCYLPISADCSSLQPLFHIFFLSVKYTDWKPSTHAPSEHIPEFPYMLPYSLLKSNQAHPTPILLQCNHPVFVRTRELPFQHVLSTQTYQLAMLPQPHIPVS